MTDNRIAMTRNGTKVKLLYPVTQAGADTIAAYMVEFRNNVRTSVKVEDLLIDGKPVTPIAPITAPVIAVSEQSEPSKKQGRPSRKSKEIDMDTTPETTTNAKPEMNAVNPENVAPAPVTTTIPQTSEAFTLAIIHTVIRKYATDIIAAMVEAGAITQETAKTVLEKGGIDISGILPVTPIETVPSADAVCVQPKKRGPKPGSKRGPKPGSKRGPKPKSTGKRGRPKGSKNKIKIGQ